MQNWGPTSSYWVLATSALGSYKTPIVSLLMSAGGITCNRLLFRSRVAFSSRLVAFWVCAFALVPCGHARDSGSSDSNAPQEGGIAKCEICGIGAKLQAAQDRADSSGQEKNPMPPSPTGAVEPHAVES